MTTILTVAGSLRAASSNAALLDAAASLAPPGVIVNRYMHLGDLPPFNSDIEEGPGPLPDAVVHWRSAVRAADAVLVSSPEYAHGVPGAFKNALDWLVGGSEVVDKPVGLLNASSASAFAHPQLVETLTVMSANVVAAASVTVDIPRRGATAESLATNPSIAPILASVINALVATACEPRNA